MTPTGEEKVTDKWRKREAYIALARSLLGYKPDYAQWDCFKWSDYTIRQCLTHTFHTRHYPVSDGQDSKHFKDKLKFDWDSHSYAPKPRVKREPQPQQSVPKHPVQDPNKKKVVMVYDVERDLLVPME